MSCFSGPEIPYKPVQIWDQNNPKGLKNIITDSTSADNPDWANNIDELTIVLFIEIIGYSTSYAYHPISKWNSSYANNCSFVLYSFQEYNSNENFPNFRWYGNVTAEDGSGWTTIAGGSFYTDSDNLYMVSLQRNAIAGGQMWIDNNKVGGRSAAGILGQTSINDNTSNIVFQFNQPGIHKIHWAGIWDRELSDAEIGQVWYAKKSIKDEYYNN